MPVSASGAGNNGFCSKCGSAFLGEEAFCTACGEKNAPLQSGRRICGACGAETDGGNAFCPVCGNKLADQRPGGGQGQGAAEIPPYGVASGYGRPGYVRDAPSGGFAVLGFFFPVIGLI